MTKMKVLVLGVASAAVISAALAAGALVGPAGGSSLTGSIIYVKADAAGANDGSSWQDAFNDLQAALAVAESGDQIWVAAGTYKPTTGADRTATFELKEGVALHGGFAGGETERDQRSRDLGRTVLSGNIGSSDELEDNSYHVVVGANGALLDGLTVTGGCAQTGQGLTPEACGAGIYNPSTSMTVSNCSIRHNYGRFGAGIFNAGPSMTIAGCEFDHNDSQDGQGGGIYNAGGALTVKNCNFDDARAADGVAIFNARGTLHVTNTSFTENCSWHADGSDGRGGVLCTLGGSATFVSCSASTNRARHGGAIYAEDTVISLSRCIFVGNAAASDGGAVFYDVRENDASVMDQCVFSRNRAEEGGAIFIGGYAEVGGPTINSCSFHGNTAREDSGGGAIQHCFGGQPRIVNCVFSGNRAPHGAAVSAVNTFKGQIPTYLNCSFRGNIVDRPQAGCIEVERHHGVVIKNCIIWDTVDEDGEPGVSIAGPGMPDIQYSCVEGGFGGTGNISEDPRFAGDLQLRANSPCIDSGTTQGAPATDILGVPRPQGDGVDMGAYESETVHVAASGRVTWWNQGLSGVAVALQPGAHTATTNANGDWSVNGLAPGEYRLTFTLSGAGPLPSATNPAGSDIWWFTAPGALPSRSGSVNRTVTVSGADLTGVDAVAARNGKIALSALLSGENSARHLCTVDPDGSSLATVHNTAVGLTRNRWSPDGKRLAFYEYIDKPRICLVNRDGSGHAILNPTGDGGTWPTWHPCGHWVYFTRLRGAYVSSPCDRVNDDTTGRFTVLSRSHEVFPSDVSSDGSRILWAFANVGSRPSCHLVHSAADISDFIQVTPSDGKAEEMGRFSADKSRVLYSRELNTYDMALYACDPNGAGRQEISTNRPAGKRDWSANWAFSDSKVLFLSDRAGASWRGDLYMVDAAGGQAVRVTDYGKSISDWIGMWYEDKPVSLTGRWATAFARNLDGAPLSGVSFTISGPGATPSGPQPVTDAGGGATWRGLEAGTYTITPQLAGYQFRPASRTFTLDDSVAGRYSDLLVFSASNLPVKIVFGRNNDIWSADPDGTNEKNLTGTPDFKEWWPRISPDGTKIAFSGAAPHGKSDIWVMNFDGTGRVNLTDTQETTEEGQSWSPDGSRIAYSGQQGSGYSVFTVRAVDGSDRKQLTTGHADAYPDWSPCGRYILFSRAMTWGQSIGHWQIHCVKRDGTGLARLTTSDRDDTVPAWSPDGTQVAFASTSNGYAWRDQVYVASFSVGATGTAQLGAWTRLSDGVSRCMQPRWSPGGRKMLFLKAAYNSTVCDIWTMNRDGSGAVGAVVTPGVRENYPDWGFLAAPPNQPPVAHAGEDAGIEQTSADGAVVTLDGSGSSDPDGDELTYTWKLGETVIAGPAGEPTAQVTLPLGEHAVTLVVSDGSLEASDEVTVTVVDTTPPKVFGKRAESLVYTTGTELWIADPDGGNPRRLDVGSCLRTPVISPDGQRILYSTLNEIVTITPDGTNRKVICTAPDGVQVGGWPRYSPDGSRVALNFHYFPTKRSDIVVLEADGTARVIVSAEFGSYTNWTRDGKRIMYCDVSGLHSIPVSPGKKPTLINAGKLNRFGAFSRDGQTYLWCLNGRVCTGRTDGVSAMTDIAELTPDPMEDYSPCWSPDESRIAYVWIERGGQPNGPLIVMDRDGSNRRTLLHGTTAVTWGHVYVGALPGDVTVEQKSPDGTPVALVPPAAVDICDADVTVTSDAPPVFPLGETIVTWTATDDSGNQATATQKVTVVDTTPPEVTGSTEVVAEQENLAGTEVDVLAHVTASDICDADLDYTVSPPGPYQLGETEVTVTVTDDSGKSSSWTLIVKVEDNTTPVLTVPADVTAEQTSRDGTPVETGQATATDICDADVTVTSDAPPVFPLGETIVTWTATDDSGNSTTATQKVTVVDTTPPEVGAKLVRVCACPLLKVGSFRVLLGAEDICDASPDVQGVMVAPDPDDCTRVKFVPSCTSRIVFKRTGWRRKKLVITLYGKKRKAMLRRLEEIRQLGGAAVTGGQCICIHKQVSGCAIQATFTYDRCGKLVGVTSPDPVLKVTAVDDSGNTACAEARPCFGKPWWWHWPRR